MDNFDFKKYLAEGRLFEETSLIDHYYVKFGQLNQKGADRLNAIINNYGADAARLFILSDSPPEKDVQWSEEGISASFNA